MTSFDEPTGWTVLLGERAGVCLHFGRGDNRSTALLDKEACESLMGFIRAGLLLLSRVDGERVEFIVEQKRAQIDREAAPNAQ
jgi:hypothetical protein